MNPPNEFSLIKKYFARTYSRDDIVLGSGDDAAIVKPPLHEELVFTIDTLVAGVHFPLETSAFDIGYKAIAVNLSDIAAMGAKPLWMTGTLTLPSVDENWIAEFARGMFTLLDQHNVALIGGDLTRGPTLTITFQAHGSVPAGKALRRDGAKVGDLIYVSGTLGDAGMGLQMLSSKDVGAVREPPAGRSRAAPTSFLDRLNRPTPRIELGLLARDYAHAAIDISDGFAQDLGHILQRSGVGAEVEINKLPLSKIPPFVKGGRGDFSALQLALTAGDDYELCLTVPPTKAQAFETAAAQINCPITCIGKITNGNELILLDEKGERVDLDLRGYQHF